MNELLRSITLDDLDGNDREIAALIGMEPFLKLVEVYGGSSKLYIPKADMLAIPRRNELIQR
ncbi:MAG: hypothetical protein RSG59_08195, partial [Ruthenibacterium sp.]